MAKEYVVAVDLGGTKLLAALVDHDLQVIAERKVRTPGTQKGDEIRDLIVGTIKDLLSEARVSVDSLSAIGVAVPGAVDSAKGLVYDTPNIGFKNYSLRNELGKVFHCLITVENDVNAGVYGEFVRGSARGLKNVIGIYPGTGIGGGIIIMGHLYRGSRGAAGELGHMRVQDGGRLCGCGRYGCLETVASKTALAKDLVALAATGKAPSILSDAGTDFSKIKSGVIRKAVKAGEPAVVELVERFAHYLGIGMANCVNLFDPDAIVLGGGLVEKLWGEIAPLAEASMKNHAQEFMAKQVKVIEASLGDHSVVTGVAALALETIEPSLTW